LKVPQLLGKLFLIGGIVLLPLATFLRGQGFILAGLAV